MAEKIDLLRQLLWKGCQTHQCPYEILSAIIGVESSWNPWVVRYEENFIHIDSPAKWARNLGITAASETVLQRFSWGLGQIMGGTLRGLAYAGPLNMLCLPDLNIDMTCQFFKKNCAKYDSVDDQIVAYNAGTPRKTASGQYSEEEQEYLDKVRKIMDQEKGKTIH